MAEEETNSRVEEPQTEVAAVEASEKKNSEKKLSKKQKKALEFRNKKKSGTTEPKDKEEKEKEKSGSKKRKATEDKDEAVPADGSAPAPAKKQKSQKQAKDSAGNVKPRAAPRFILFCGNLPFSYPVEKLEAHFEAAAPLTIRPRENAGFAFLEFPSDASADKTNGDASRRLKVALRLHHSMFMNRRINVELTAGGGGNSGKRRGKIEEKKEKYAAETSERLKEEQAAREKREKAQRRREAKERKSEYETGQHRQSGVHPDRLKKLL